MLETVQRSSQCLASALSQLTVGREDAEIYSAELPKVRFAKIWDYLYFPFFFFIHRKEVLRQLCYQRLGTEQVAF